VLWRNITDTGFPETSASRIASLSELAENVTLGTTGAACFWSASVGTLALELSLKFSMKPSHRLY
jgi:hypothetical protein